MCGWRLGGLVETQARAVCRQATLAIHRQTDPMQEAILGMDGGGRQKAGPYLRRCKLAASCPALPPDSDQAIFRRLGNRNHSLHDLRIVVQQKRVGRGMLTSKTAVGEWARHGAACEMFGGVWWVEQEGGGRGLRCFKYEYGRVEKHAGIFRCILKVPIATGISNRRHLDIARHCSF